MHNTCMNSSHAKHMHELSFTNSSSSISQAQTNSEAYLKARVWAGKQGKAHGATKEKGKRHSHTHSLTLTQTKENGIKEKIILVFKWEFGQRISGLVATLHARCHHALNDPGKAKERVKEGWPTDARPVGGTSTTGRIAFSENFRKRDPTPGSPNLRTQRYSTMAKVTRHSLPLLPNSRDSQTN